MKSNISWRTALAQTLAGAAAFIALAAPPAAQADDEREQQGRHEHLVTDWSHRHAVYSSPKTLMRQFQLSGDARYVQQWKRRAWEQRHGDRNEWRWHRAPDGTKQLQGDWSMNMGAGATVGAGNYPAKFSFTTTSANCVTPAPPVGQQPDFVVYNTSVAGSGTQATIVAFSNLYSSCTGGTPQTYWSYNTGTGSSAVTSPVLSPDGTQVAFIQNNGTTGTLVVLRWKAGTGTLGTPVTPATGACTALTAPCMTTVTFSTANGDTTTADSFASPYVDYGNDALYVGDNAGFLHKFSSVFQGTPAEVVSTGPATLWPAALDAGFGHLNSAVAVPDFNEVLVTDSSGVIYAVDTTNGFVGSNFIDPKLASPGFDDGPIVDVTAGVIYLFARASSEFITPTGVASVFQIPLPHTPADIHNAAITQAVVSTDTTLPTPGFYLGAFDNQYYITDATGYLYVCSTAGNANALWQIHVVSGVMDSGAAFQGPTLTTANSPCSPVTEFFNGTTDRMFVSVGGNARTAVGCPSNTTGCIMSFGTDPVAFSPATTALAATSVTGGTSGIVIDNSSAAGGASQVYFTPLGDQTCTTSGGTGGCAIQASQSALN